MTTAEIVAETGQFVRESFLYARPDLDLRPDLPLLEAGIIDSMGVMELIDFLQARFGISIDDAEITEENLGTLHGIAALVRRKRGSDGLVAA